MDGGFRSFACDAALFVALLATSFALGGALAHAFELPNKIGLGRDAYFTVQTIYSGWDRQGYVLAVELAGIIAVIFLYRTEPRAFWPACVALGGLIGAQIVFWVWTFPANQASANWTRVPEQWETLRRQWEYSHAVNGLVVLVGFCAVVLAGLTSRERLQSDRPA